MVRESNERMQNAKLVHLPGAVNCAGGADLSKVQPALHFLVERNFNISKWTKLKFDIHYSCIE